MLENATALLRDCGGAKQELRFFARHGKLAMDECPQSSAAEKLDFALAIEEVGA